MRARPFVSKAQWRRSFAIGSSWSRRRASVTESFDALPDHDPNAPRPKLVPLPPAKRSR
ncbi:MAG: hypothetical protein J2P57_16920 [Acidimicrobiaceae bacterium]|nr:hypothetical protein [Acidimicrobiaceae bacterium]